MITRERLIDEVWDVNWFGSTKTLDVHVSSLRRKLGDELELAALHPHRARRRLPLLAAPRSSSREPAHAAAGRLRVRPRARDRGAARCRWRSTCRGASTPRSAARPRARRSCSARCVVGPARRPRRARAPGRGPRGADLGGRVIVVDPRGRLLADSAGPGRGVGVLRLRPEIAARARRRAQPGRAPQRLARREPAVHRRARGRRSGRTVGRRAGDPERRRGQPRGPQRRARAGRRGRARAAARARRGLAAGRLARAAAARRSRAPPAASPAAISTRGRAWRARRSSARWRRPSTT